MAGDVPLAQKIIDAKDGAGVTERCVTVNGTDAPLELCDATVDPTIFSSPRIEAGGGDNAPINGVGPAVVGFTDDRLDCETMPIEDFVYAGRSFAEVFTEEQQAALKEAYPTGVCDYSKPGRGFQAAVPWLTYQDAAGTVVYGGRAMGAPPTSETFVLAAAAQRVPEAAPAASPGDRLPATGGASPLVAGSALLALAATTRRWSRRADRSLVSVH